MRWRGAAWLLALPFESYPKSFRWKFGSTQTVEGILQRLTKKDYGPFFAANDRGVEMLKDGRRRPGDIIRPEREA